VVRFAVIALVIIQFQCIVSSKVIDLKNEIYQIKYCNDFTFADNPDNKAIAKNTESWQNNVSVVKWADSTNMGSPQQTGWMRFYFNIDNALLSENLSLIIPAHYGSIEIYFNEKKILENQNTTSSGIAAENIYTKTAIIDIPLNLINSGLNVLAIKLKSRIQTNGGGFKDYLYIGPRSLIIKKNYFSIFQSATISAIFLFLFFLFILFYIYKKEKKDYFYFALLAFLLFAGYSGTDGLASYIFEKKYTDIFLTHARNIFIVPLLIYFLLTFYSLPVKRSVSVFCYLFYFYFPWLTIEYLATSSFVYYSQYIYFLVLFSAVSGLLYSIFISINTVRQKLPLSKIILSGIFFLSLGFFTSIINSTNIIPYFFSLSAEAYFAMILLFFAALAAQLIGEIKELKVADTDLKIIDKMKNSFISGISHDLNSSINGILGLSEILLSEEHDLNKKQASLIKLIENNAVQLSEVVRELIDTTQSNKNKIVLNKSFVSVNKTVQNAMHKSALLRSGKKINIINKIDHSLPYIFADHLKWEQILDYILNNAIKYTYAGTITIDAQSVKNDVIIYISDSEDNLKMKNESDQYKPFYHAQLIPDRIFGGTGLGLSIVWYLVQLHGGCVQVQSNTNGGITFEITMPAYKINGEFLLDNSFEKIVNKNQFQIPHEIQNKKEGQKHIVLIDEDLLGARINFDRLIESGYYVTSLHSMDDINSFFDNIKSNMPDLFIIDSGIDDNKGDLLCTRIKKEYAEYDFPVIFLTGKSDNQELVKILNSGADETLAKPVISYELIHHVKNTLMIKDAAKNNIIDTKKNNSRLESFVKKLFTPKIIKSDKCFIEITNSQESKYPGFYYDFFRDANGNIGFLVTDLPDEGVYSQILGALLKMTFSQQEVLANSPAHLVTQLNFSISEFLDIYTIPVSYMYFDTVKQKLLYTASGMPSMIIYKKKENRCIVYESFPNALGWNKNFIYSTKEISIGSGDKIIIFTAGIYKNRHISGEYFTEENILDIIKKHHNATPRRLLNSLIKEIQKQTLLTEELQNHFTLAAISIL